MILEQLGSIELRIIGCLIEKENTTPDQYPLSLNSLTLACNQKSNREPVLDLSENQVQKGIDSLNERGLIMEASGYGARVAKYKHRFCNTEFSELQLNQKQIAIICLLFLRGPQTPGELRTRTQRLATFGNVVALEQELRIMEEHTPPFVKQLKRELGKRESRFIHLFGSEQEIGSENSSQLDSIVEVESLHNSTSNNLIDDQTQSRISALETEVAELRTIVDELKVLLE